MKQIVLPAKTFGYDSFTEERFREQTGFSKADAQRLFVAWGVPEEIAVYLPVVGPRGRQGGRVAKKKWSASGLHCFVFALHRMYRPNDLIQDKQEFRYSYSSLSAMFTGFCKWMDQTHGHRLQDIPIAKAEYFNQCIITKLREVYPAIVLPPDAENVFTFTDGNRRRICRPEGVWGVQKAFFSGDKWYCNVGSQCMCGPDGIIYDWFMGPVGRHSDQYFFHESDLNERLRTAQIGNLIQYWTYTDKGYVAASHTRCSHRAADAWDRHFDTIMSTARVAVEWGFGKIQHRCSLLVKSYYLKVMSVDVERLTRCAVLFTNSHTCLHHLGSNTGVFFNCLPPTLEQYFA